MQQESEPAGSSASFFVISQAVLHSGKTQCPVQPVRSPLPVAREAVCSLSEHTLEQKSNTVVEIGSPLHSTPPRNKGGKKSLNSPHQSPASCMFTSASPVLGHERYPPCSPQLHLARVTREKVSTAKHSCSAQKQPRNQPPRGAIVEQRGKEGANGRTSC